MITALYYPYTSIRNKPLLKSALLLWDTVECIVPPDLTITPHRLPGKLYNEAVDLVVRPHVPTRQQQTAAHRSLTRFLREAPPPSFFTDWVRRKGPYLVYPDKFAKQTWRLLEKFRYAEFDAHSADFAVDPGVGLLMMALLADECAGTQKQKITDRTQAYAYLCEYYSNLLGGEFVTGLDASAVGPQYDRLVTITLQVLGASQVPISKLVAMRKREAKGRSGDYRAMRQRYRNALTQCVDRLRTQAKSNEDVREIERQFREDIRQDLVDLRNELRIASVRSLLSKEFALTILALAGALVTPISGVTNLALTLQGIAVIPLIKGAIEYRATRRKVLRSSNMSWLYLTQQRPVALC